ncbi:MAG: hypothetical protein ABR530_01575 [Pyrinomonadaceae bacterium]
MPGQPGSAFPFSTRLPETYQATFVVSAGGVDKKWFMARAAERWRYDRFVGEELSSSDLFSDRLYLIDHSRKIYCAQPIGFQSSQPAYMSLTPATAFIGKEHREFEAMGRDGDISKYRVTNKYGQEIIISVHEPSGMIVRQEFTAGDGNTAGQPQFIYEVRDLKLEADQNQFVLPTGYRNGEPTECRAGKGE